MIRNYFKYRLFVYVFASYFSFLMPVSAGSFEDFFSAVERDDPRTISSLLARGFDPNTRDAKGQGGLYLAFRHESYKALDALLAAPKIDVELRNQADESPLMMAAFRGRLDTAKALIAKGADVNKPGWTPLHYAATNGHVELIHLLLEEHAFIDAESPTKTTPLMMAASYGNPQAVKLLLEEGADPLAKNNQGLTALDFAQRAQRLDSADIISAFVRAKAPKGKW